MLRLVILLTLLLSLKNSQAQTFFQFHQLTWGWKINATYSSCSSHENLSCLYTESQLFNYRSTFVHYDELGKLEKSQEGFIKGYRDVYANRYESFSNKYLVYGQGEDVTNGKATKFTILYDENFNLVWKKGNKERVENHVFIDTSRILLQCDSSDENAKIYNSSLGLFNLKSGIPLWKHKIHELLGTSISSGDSLRFRSIINIRDTIRVIIKNNYSQQYFFIEMNLLGQVLTIRDKIIDTENLKFIGEQLYSNSAYGNYPKHRYQFEYFDYNTLNVIWSYSDSTSILDDSEIPDIEELNENELVLLIKRRAHEIVSGEDSVHSEVHFINKKTGLARKKVRYEVKERSISFTSISVLENSELYLSGNLFFFDAELSWGVISRTDSTGMVQDTILRTTEINDTVLSMNFIHELRNELDIFPNPTNNLLNIISSEDSDLTFNLTNLNGEILISGKVQPSSKVDVSDMPNGIYFLQIQGKGTLETRKIIVSH